MKKIKVKQIASSVRRQPYQKKNLIGEFMRPPNFHSFIYLGNKMNERLVTSELRQ